MKAVQINRKQVREILGISKNKLSEIIRNQKHMKFPKQVNSGLMNQLYYEHEVLAFKKREDYHNIRWTSADRPIDVRKDGFDNALATHFITRPALTDEKLSFSQVIKKHMNKPGAKTTVVHLEERNDYTPPRGGMALYRTGDSYRIAHEGGGW